MVEHGYDSTIHIAMAASGKELEEYKLKLVKGVDHTEESLHSYEAMRFRLLPRYQLLLDDDLITETILLSGRKPLQPQSTPGILAGPNGPPRGRTLRGT